MDYRLLYAKTVAELRAIAREEKIRIPAGASKAKIVELLLEIENGRAAELALQQAQAQRSAEEKLAEKKTAANPSKPAANDPDEAKAAEPADPPKKRRGRPPKAVAEAEKTEPEERKQPEQAVPPADQPQENPQPEKQPYRIGGYTVRRTFTQTAQDAPAAERKIADRAQSAGLKTSEQPQPAGLKTSEQPQPAGLKIPKHLQPAGLKTSEQPQPAERKIPDREYAQRPFSTQNAARPSYERADMRGNMRQENPYPNENREEHLRADQAGRQELRAGYMRQENPWRAENHADYAVGRREGIRQEQPRFVRREFVPQDPSDVTRAVSDLLAAGDCAEGGGVLEPMPDGYGFLRAENYQQGTKDVYVSAAQIRRFDLRMGDLVRGKVRPQREGDRYTGLLFIDTVNGESPAKAMRRPRFEDLTPIYPQERIRLESKTGKGDTALRVIDLLAPIGRGQRAMIVSQPKAGKTVLLKKIANAITENEPDIELIVLLIDERPEEVTDMQRSIKGDVVYSTFDEMPENHARVAEMVLERAQRLVEQGKDVVILLDSITRLARAYNLVIPPTGRTLSGGIDPGALHKPKRFFGAARNIENGGSLTIIATALVETGSRMDDIIFEEFKGTGNSEIHLDRRLSEKRIFPAIDMNKSGTRREDLLFTPEEAEGALAVRRMLSGGSNQDAVEQLTSMLHKTQTNAEFLQQLRGLFAKNEKDGFSYGGR